MHLADLKMPKGVESVQLMRGDNAVVATVQIPRALVEPEPEVAAVAEAAAVGRRAGRRCRNDAPGAAQPLRMQRRSRRRRKARRAARSNFSQFLAHAARPSACLSGGPVSFFAASPTIAMKLVVGLGNPGREHEATRHNAGFWWVDRLAARGRRAACARKRAFTAMPASWSTAGRECWLLKPDTYMNLSGRAVQALAQFYKIAPDGHAGRAR